MAKNKIKNNKTTLVAKQFAQSLEVFKGLGVSGIQIGKTRINMGRKK